MRHRRTPPRALMLALAALVVTARPAPLAGQAAQTEGYDPLRQITAQLIKANLLIVQDVTGSMAQDIYSFYAPNGSNTTGTQNAHGRLYWETLNTTPTTWSTPSNGTVTFGAKQVSGGTDRTVTVTNVTGLTQPGIYTVSFSGNTGPQYTDTASGKLVYATQMPVLTYSGGSYYLAYKCKPTGSWTAGGKVPWSTTASWYKNNSFDFTQCSTGWGQGMYFTNPSRIMNVKNALGNSVYIGSSYTPPPVPASGALLDRWNNAAWDTDWNPWVTKAKTAAGPTIVYDEAYKSMGADPSSKSYRFKLEPGYELVTAAAMYNPTGATPVNPASKVNWIKDPGVPFPAFYTAATATPYKDKNGDDVRSPGLTSTGGTIPAGNWSLGWPTDTSKYGTVIVEPPGDIVGKNANRVNFGLMTFSSSWTSGRFPYLFPIDVQDTNNVERLEAFFAAYEDPTGTDVYSKVPKEGYPINTASSNYETKQLGLTVTGGTNTKTALDFARTIIQTTFDGGNLADDNNTWKLIADPKKTCQRTYGVILVTDGMSNTSNSYNSAWVSPATTSDANQRVYVDVANSSEANCPNKWADYAAGKADEIFKLKLDKGESVPAAQRYVYPRTWAIGISPLVGPCELDMIAYMGRTDASSPSGDAGFSGYRPADKAKGDPGNPFLPEDKLAAGEWATVAANPINSDAGNYDGPTGDRVWAPYATKQRPEFAYPSGYSGWTKNVGSPAKPFWQWYRGTYRAPKDIPGPWEAYLPPLADQEPKDKDPDTGQVVKPHGHNAYFANDAKSLSEAFAAIVNATATGDYATNAPVSGMSAAAENTVYLPSTSFPNWRGHLYAFNIKLKEGQDGYVAWDAGEKLAARAASLRKIFTWDPATNDLVEVTQANLTKAPLKDVAGLTAAVVDFIRGNDGTLTDKLRSWPLGPMINSAPAIVASPGSWTQNTVVDHKSFQLSTGSRDPLLWVGSNDGMLHAFRSTDGIEQIAILPPSLLPTQVTLYNNYVEEPKYPSGQSPDILKHIYGVANSFRFGDVYFGGEGYKTIGIVTFGAGASDLFAMDVTRVPKPDAASYPSEPVKILWTKTTGGSSTSTTLEKLSQTFSIPAMAPVTSNTWRLVGASGFNPGNSRTTQGTASFVAPRTYVLNPTDGSIVETKSLTSLSTPAPFVGNQAFADSVLFDPKAKAYQEDNVARLGLQADLNGQIWFLYASNQYSNTDFDVAKVGIDVSNDISPAQSQPIYYNPAASGVGADLQGCVAYAFGSGTLYEQSAKITGAGIGTAPNFVPRIYVATGKKASFTDKLTSANIKAKDISGSWTVTKADESTYTAVFGKRTQLTAPPFMLVPKSGTGDNTALFLLYDPDNGCNGFSYVVVVDFQGNSSCEPGNPKYTAYEAGVGAASGFTIAGDKVLVSKSGIGEGQQAGLYEPPNITAAIGGNPTPKVRWWKELK